MTPPVTLGYLWQCRHTQYINWVVGRVVSWSLFCLMNCLNEAAIPVPHQGFHPSDDKCDGGYALV